MEIINSKSSFSLLFLNINISVNLYPFDLKFAMYILNVLFEGIVSQIFDLGP